MTTDPLESIIEGTVAVDWVIVGPIVVDNVKNLDLTQVGELIENSHPVATFGEWSVRRVNDTYKQWGL